MSLEGLTSLTGKIVGNAVVESNGADFKGAHFPAIIAAATGCAYERHCVGADGNSKLARNEAVDGGQGGKSKCDETETDTVRKPNITQTKDNVERALTLALQESRQG